MHGPGEKDHWIRFGVYEVNTTERIVLRKGVKLRLQDKPFSLLVLLLHAPGQLVDREELRRKLWSDGTYVDFEHGLRVAMHKLRTSLDDTAESPRYIETVPGHGYRFIAPISKPQTNTRTESRASLIVLPFVGLASEIQLDHIADGFTEELTAQLSKAMPRRMSVIGRTTAMCYKGANKSIAEIGKEIGVDYALEGSVRSQDGVLRLTAQLIRVSDQSHVWAESLQGDSLNPVHTQIALSDQITRALANFLFPAEPLFHIVTKQHPNEEAYQLYRQGCKHYPGAGERDGMMGAMCFHQAIDKDPEFAQPYALLGIAYTSAAMFDSGTVTNTSLPSFALQGKHFATRSLELDPSSGEAHCAVAIQKLHFGWDWKTAEYHFRKALELNPNFTFTPLLYAWGLLQVDLVREAQAHIDMARKLDPLSPFVSQWTAWLSYLSGDLKHARTVLERELAINPDYLFTSMLLGDVYIHGGQPERSVPLLRKLFLTTNHTLVNASLVCAYAKMNQREEAHVWLNTLEDSMATHSVSPYHHAMALASLAEIDRAFAMLEKAVVQRSGWMPQLPIDPGFRVLHSDPRWLSLLERTSPLRPQHGGRT